MINHHRGDIFTVNIGKIRANMIYPFSVQWRGMGLWFGFLKMRGKNAKVCRSCSWALDVHQTMANVALKELPYLL
jgi:hypothetical protein